MALVTGDVSYDFSVLPDQSPYTNADFTDIFTLVGGTANISSGGLAIFGCWRLNESPSNNIITVKVQTTLDSTTFGSFLGAAIVNVSGNGYGLLVRGDDVYVRLINSGVIDAGFVIRDTTVPFAAGSDFYMTLDVSTGDISMGIGNTELASGNDVTYSTGLGAGILRDTNGGSSGRIASWAADGYEPATSVTTTGPHSVGDTFTATTSGLGTITTATAADPNGNVMSLGIASTGVDTADLTITDFTTAAQQGVLLGTVTLTVGDGTDTAETTFTLNPKTGYANQPALGLTVPATDETAANYGVWEEEPEDGDAFYYPNDTVTVAPNGDIDTSGIVGSYFFEYFIIDQNTGVLSQVDKTFEAEATNQPDQFTLGADVTDAEPNAITRRSFVVAGLDGAEPDQTFEATGTGQVSLTETSGYGASVDAGNGDTVWFELDAGPDFEDVTTGGVTCNGISDSMTVTVRAQEAPELLSTRTLQGSVGQAFSVQLSTSGGDTPASWNITGGADQAQYSLTNSGVLSRTVNQDTIEAETVVLDATNAAGTSGSQTLTINFTAGGSGDEDTLTATPLTASVL